MRRTGTARTRVVAVVTVAVVLLLAGSTSAWAWWVASTTASATGAAASLAAPGGLDASCNPQLNLRADPVVVSWSPVPPPAGATAVRYRVQLVNDAGVARSFPATGETATTSVSIASTQLGSGADRTRVQTITVTAYAVFPTGTLRSGASGAVSAHGVSIFGVVDMHC